MYLTWLCFHYYLYTHIHKENKPPFIIEGKLGEPSIFFLNKEALKIAGNLDHINNFGDSYHK